MQIPVLSGIYTDDKSRFRTAYPRNLIPVPKSTGISDGYLAPAPGIVSFGTGAGNDRGGINWRGTCYRVSGQYLVSIDQSGSVSGSWAIPGADRVKLDYSFDNLAIAANNSLYIFNGTTVTQVTDGDLGTVLDVIWVDGYYMTTDGSYLVVTELGNPFSVNPLKYGSSEADPDPIVALLKVRNEPYALNRYTIEVFDNVGGSLFPFARNEGAQIQKGVVGGRACCVFRDAVAFVGGGRNEKVSVYIGANGQAIKIAPEEIDTILSGYSEVDLAACYVESRVDGSHQFLYVHLPDKSLVYDAGSSEAAQQPIWVILTTSVVGDAQYKAQGHVWCYNKWIVGDPSSQAIGYLSESVSSHYGDVNGWEFSTQILYNDSRGAVFHSLELVSLTGRLSGVDPVIWASYSLDGISWSTEIPKSAGRYGERNRRIAWFQNGHMRDVRIQKFRGTSDAHISIARLEANIEQLYV